MWIIAETFKLTSSSSNPPRQRSAGEDAASPGAVLASPAATDWKSIAVYCRLLTLWAGKQYSEVSTARLLILVCCEATGQCRCPSSTPSWKKKCFEFGHFSRLPKKTARRTPPTSGWLRVTAMLITNDHHIKYFSIKLASPPSFLSFPMYPYTV